ncbi:hypothetical protein [Roseibium sp.]
MSPIPSVVIPAKQSASRDQGGRGLAGVPVFDGDVTALRPRISAALRPG